MKKTVLIIAIFLIISTLNAIAPKMSFAQGGISGGGNTVEAPIGILDRIKGVFNDSQKLVAQGGELTSTVQKTAEKQGWKEVLGKVWNALKSFFGDETIKNLLIETAKLSLRLFANVFTLIAGALNKILEVVGS
ncbi:MAG: hypothetical protein Q7S09_00520 [bacterium]|nr:hypothetical protein [bacterium]